MKNKKIIIRQGEKIKDNLGRSRLTLVVQCPKCKVEHIQLKRRVNKGENTLCENCGGSYQMSNPNRSNRLHRIYRAMKGRCKARSRYNKVFSKKGIIMNFDWFRDVATFKEWALANGYSDNKYLRRKNPYQGYSPDNCEWIDMNAYISKHPSDKVTDVSEYLGVEQHGRKYYAMNHYGSKPKRIGIFDSPHEAAKAYNKWVIINDLPDELNPILGKVNR